jgi:hypothetical protein
MGKVKNPELKPNDRIILIHMPGEKLTIGTKGKVKKIVKTPSFPGSLGYSYDVEWYDENGDVISTLSLIPEADSWLLDDTSINETKKKILSIDDIEKRANFLDLFKKKDYNHILEFFEHIRTLGVVNMYESTQFLGETKEYLEKYFNLYRYNHDISEENEELIEKIIEMTENIRNIMISASIYDLEQKNIEITASSVTNRFRRLKKELLMEFINKKS